MDLSTTQRWTLLVALGGSTTAARIASELHPANLPPAILAATHGPQRDGKVRVELTVGGRDRWDIQRQVRAFVAGLGAGQVIVSDITAVKGSVTRPRGGARGRRPQVDAGEVPAGPPRKSRSCTKCDHRPKSKGQWSHDYGGAGR